MSSKLAIAAGIHRRAAVAGRVGGSVSAVRTGRVPVAQIVPPPDFQALGARLGRMDVTAGLRNSMRAMGPETVSARHAGVPQPLGRIDLPANPRNSGTAI